VGSTFSTMHVFNKQQAKPTQIKKLFSEHMKKKGFAPADEDSASRSYQFVFSKNSNWITVILPNQEIGEPDEKEAEDMSKALKCVCLETYVCDSDFAMLRLVDSVNGRKDTVFVGDDEMLEGYGIESKGINRECWEPLLDDGRTWEELVQVWGDEYVFPEASFSKTAPLIGMDIRSVQNDYLSHAGQSKDYKVLDLHFKEAGKKTLSLDAAFKQVFGEALEPLGFKKIKGRQPYFVRLIGDEILHIITYIKTESQKFEIFGGVATVYCQRIALDLTPRENDNWLKCNLTFYRESNPFEMNRKYSYHDLTNFPYVDEMTPESLLRDLAAAKIVIPKLPDALRNALDITKEIMLPVLDKAVDIASCMDCFYMLGLPMELSTPYSYYKGTFGDKIFGSHKHDKLGGEWILHFKVNDRDDYSERQERGIERYYAKSLHYAKTGRSAVSPESYEEDYKESKEAKPKRLAHDHKIFDDHEWCTKAFAELERRKAANLEILRSYGFKL